MIDFSLKLCEFLLYLTGWCVAISLAVILVSIFTVSTWFVIVKISDAFDLF